MGMFSSLFGSSGSDKADKMRQSALDAFNSIKTPALADLQVQLDKEVSAGTLTPAQAEAQLLQSNAFNDIATDPSLTGAAKQALVQLQQIGTQGGMTAIDKAQLQDITNQTNQQAKSRNASVLQNAQERGVGGSGLEMANTLMSEQAAADRASQAGTDVAANAQQRALQAIQAAGGLGQSLEGQEFGEKATKANAQNAIDLFNAQTGNETNRYNTGTANQAQAANLENAQNISNANTGIANTNKTYNAAQNQTVFNDALQKAQGIAGQYDQWAKSAEDQKKAEQGADLALTGGLIQGGATAGSYMMGGPAAGAVTSGATKKIGPQFPGQGVGYSEGGEVTPEENKAMSPDHAEPENRYSHECFGQFCSHPEHSLDIAPPLNENKGLSREEAEPENKSLEDAYNDFVKQFAYGGSVKMANGGMVTIKPGKAPLGYDEGGVVSSTEPVHPPIPEVKKEEPKDDRSWAEKLGELLGSHATKANEYADLDKANGGMINAPIHDFRAGGQVPGTPEVSGDSPKNDVVSAKLSPGEIVLPRTVVQHPQEVPKFVDKTLAKEDPMTVALRRLRQPKGV